MRDLDPQSRAALAAAWTLLVWSSLSTIALSVFVSTSPSPFGFAAIVTGASIALAVGASFFVWRAPSRVSLGAGIAAMGLSLLRVLGSEWTWASYALVALTLLFLIPVVHAFLLMPKQR